MTDEPINFDFATGTPEELDAHRAVAAAEAATIAARAAAEAAAEAARAANAANAAAEAAAAAAGFGAGLGAGRGAGLGAGLGAGATSVSGVQRHPGVPAAATETPATRNTALADATTTQALPPLPNSLPRIPEDPVASDYPFAIPSRFQTAAAPRRASSRQRLLYGILAALVAVLAAAAIVVGMQILDQSVRR